MSMSEKRKPEDIWNAERILYGYIYDSDEDGYLPDVENMKKSSYKIGLQRFYAAMKAYGKNPTWFYRRDGQRSDNRDIYRGLLSQSRSSEKMNEFREMVKEHLWQGVISDFFSKVIDKPDYLKHDIEVSIVFRNLMEYRRRLYAAENIWSGMIECSQSIGSIYQMTQGLNSEFLWPLCKIVDKMIILLMGDDYDKVFMVEDLTQFGYPDITDEEFNRMISEEW